MADVQRVYNPETKCKMKLKKALDMQNQCLIEINMATMTYKNLTLAQIVQRRSALQAVLISGFTYYVEGKDGKLVPKAYFAELPGLIFKPAQKDQALTRQGFALIQQANHFCLEHA